MEIKCTPRVKVYGVEFSGLLLNLTERFTAIFNAITEQSSLSYVTRVHSLDQIDQLFQQSPQSKNTQSLTSIENHLLKCLEGSRMRYRPISLSILTSPSLVFTFSNFPNYV